MSLDIAARLWSLAVGGSIHWSLPADAPREIAIGALPGWHLLTPLGAMTLGRDVDFDLGMTRAGVALISTRQLLLRCDQPATFETVHRVGPRVLSILRHIACQATLPRKVHGWSAVVSDSGVPDDPNVTQTAIGVERNTSDSPNPSSTQPAEQGVIITQDYIARNVLTNEHLGRIAKLLPNHVVPICVDVLLDALEAHVEQDYRKALLYGAIAVESLALEQLENAYSEALAASSLSLHAVEVRTSDGTSFKDPALPSDSSFFALTHDGARDGLNAAVEVFRWFGDTSPYTVAGESVTFPEGKVVCQWKIPG